MYQSLAFVTGIILAVMISVNGGLSGYYGVFPATVIIHLVGTIFSLFFTLKQYGWIKLTGFKPVWIYLGGAIGVFTVVFNNLAFSKLSVTNIIALALFGQTITALIFDHFGLLGMKKIPFKKTSLLGLSFSLFGIWQLLDTSVSGAILAVLYAVTSGVTVVLSRSVNTQLSEKIGAMHGALVNHVVGLIVSILILFFVNIETVPFKLNNPLMYFGGVLGVVVVYLSNIVVPKVSSFNLTILSFVGQVLMGLALDLILTQTYSVPALKAALIIATGILLTMLTEKVSIKRTNKI
ncbi:DMT family transporter [Fundicoccus ignavus]|nr:DMT family transporter [Fundicoccus ignavus]